MRPVETEKQLDQQLLGGLLEDMQNDVARDRMEASGYKDPSIAALYTQTAECRLMEARALWRLLDRSGFTDLGSIPE